MAVSANTGVLECGIDGIPKPGDRLQMDYAFRLGGEFELQSGDRLDSRRTPETRHYFTVESLKRSDDGQIQSLTLSYEIGPSKGTVTLTRSSS